MNDWNSLQDTQPPPFAMGDNNFPDDFNYTHKMPHGHPSWEVFSKSVPPPVDDGTPLFPILYKLWLASEKTKLINTETSKLAQSGSYKIATSRETSKRYVTRFTEVGKIPHTIPVLVGEIAYHLRSSLDHILFAAIKPQTAAKKKRCQFPICSSVEAFSNAQKRGYMPGISATLLDHVKSVQTYISEDNAVFTNADRNGLRQIQEVNNWDKHRTVPICVLFVARCSAQIRVFEGLEPKTKFHPGHANEGSIVATVDYPEVTIGAEREAQYDFSLKPSFDNTMHPCVCDVPVVRVLSTCGRFIQRSILPIFEQYF